MPETLLLSIPEFRDGVMVKQLRTLGRTRFERLPVLPPIGVNVRQFLWQPIVLLKINNRTYEPLALSALMEIGDDSLWVNSLIAC